MSLNHEDFPPTKTVRRLRRIVAPVNAVLEPLSILLFALWLVGIIPLWPSVLCVVVLIALGGWAGHILGTQGIAEVRERTAAAEANETDG